MALYAGEDEFASRAELSLRLSRGGVKETTLDYEPARYAQRRGINLESAIVVPQRAQGPVKEKVARTEPAPARTMAQALFAESGKGQITRKTSAPDRIDALADYLQLRQHHENRALREGRDLEQKFSRAPARERATAEAVKRELKVLKPPGLFSGKATRAAHEAQLARLHAVGRTALEAEAQALRQLDHARALQTGAPGIADRLIEKAQPGLVAQMQPLLADSTLIRQAKERLADRAAQAATLQQVARIFGAIKEHADGRLLKSFGYGDEGSHWKALPQPVRDLVEGVNRAQGSRREALLKKLQESMRETPEKALVLGAAMKAAEKSQERGFSR